MTMEALGERNDAYPVSVEHKLGIHGSPTCVMAYGDVGSNRLTSSVRKTTGWPACSP